MNNAKKIILLAVCITHYSIATASEIKIDCPESINSTESLQTTNDAWQVEADLGKRSRFLDTIAIYSGNPKEMASLVPNKIKQKNRKRTSIWEFSKSSAGEFWVSCTYTNSMLMLAKPLPKNVQRCELTERLLATGVSLGIENMRCE